MFLLIYIIGIIVFVIDLALTLQKSYFEEEGIFRSISDIITALFYNPTPLMLLSWFGLLINFNNNKK
tara:strand:+ start:97823 stop:98023 length:201 start_codon:yes stop_codon:yes gene_type:complete